jgi:hypothetical protein
VLPAASEGPPDGAPTGRWPGIPLLTGLVVTAAGWLGIRRVAARYPSIGDGHSDPTDRE